jgi:L-asparagine transporter-like permease
MIIAIVRVTIIILIVLIVATYVHQRHTLTTHHTHVSVMTRQHSLTAKPQSAKRALPIK